MWPLFPLLSHSVDPLCQESSAESSTVVPWPRLTSAAWILHRLAQECTSANACLNSLLQHGSHKAGDAKDDEVYRRERPQRLK